MIGEELIFTVFHFVVEVVLVGTGEGVRWALTRGRYKPRWDQYHSKRAGEQVLLSEPSLYVGAAFWLLVGIAVFVLVR